ncbi:MAG TPA: nicotinate-nucleotide adenylyltransferase, partial [Gemmataceae bacterium]|nr:nicotinate-nucleotide adenylyltransferase [Gemmataceae bacterium]
MDRRRIGVFGGTFDPVHLGHLILAEQCREQGRLDAVWFVPAARPPHKVDQPLTPFAQRVEMLALALAGNAAFRVEQSEKDRPGPSFTVDTLEELGRQHPDADFSLLVGSDTLNELHTWREPARIVARAALLVVDRPGFPALTAERFREELHLPEGFPLRVQTVEAPLIHIASRDLRRRAAEGRSLRYLVPRAVEMYVQEKRLYRPDA